MHSELIPVKISQAMFMHIIPFITYVWSFLAHRHIYADSICTEVQGHFDRAREQPTQQETENALKCYLIIAFHDVEGSRTFIFMLWCECGLDQQWFEIWLFVLLFPKLFDCRSYQTETSPLLWHGCLILWQQFCNA